MFKKIYHKSSKNNYLNFYFSLYFFFIFNKTKSMKFFVILISIFLLSILVFNSIKIKIEFFQCSSANSNQYPNCEYNRYVNILYLNPPTPDPISTYATVNPITGIQPGQQIKYSCDNASGNCLYNLIPNSNIKSIK